MIHTCQKLTVFSLGTPIRQRFTHVPCLRSYHSEKIGSRSIHQVKPGRARIVLGWLTAWKYLLLYTFFFFNYTIEVFWLFQNMSFVLSTFTNASCPRSHHMERTRTRLVALCVIREYLALFRSCRSWLTL